MTPTPALMLQGTGSDVGKSLLVTGLCRAYANRGLTVRPFKPQNMSNNAAVTADGGEIGRAQALQARACRTPPLVDMNPVLLKPQTEVGAQLVVHGRIRGNAGARQYQAIKGTLLPEVVESFERLGAAADLMLVEGAGSAAEVNLRQGDIANMGFATATGTPVALVGDIERGGVIAALVGTWHLLGAAERTLLAGSIVNRFRGDASLFDEGRRIVERETGRPCFGVVPHFPEARRLPAEDALAVSRAPAPGGALDRPAAIKVAVPLLARIANFDDLDPLIAEPGVSVDFVEPGRALPGDADLVVLPGSKATLADLELLRDQGWDVDLVAHRRRGGLVLGICGGFQMLGRWLRDPRGVEGAPADAPGLGLLAVETTLTGDKTLRQVEGVDLVHEQPVTGYEMHVGETSGGGLGRPLLRLGNRSEGAVSEDGRVMGCYLHGLFASDGYRHAFLDAIRSRDGDGLAYEAEVEAILDRLAAHLEAHLNLDALLAVARRN